MKKIIITAASFLLTVTFHIAVAQNSKEIKGIPVLVKPVNTETTASIMKRQSVSPAVKFRERPEKEYPDRSRLKQNPLAPAVSSYPANTQQNNSNTIVSNSPATPTAPQTPGTTFNAVTGPAETGAFPPDDMGAIGPTQYILFVNGKLRSFNKNTGLADGVLNVNPDVFFSSVMTPPVSSNYTSDPRIRYDRLSGRWLLIILDVPGGGSLANRCLLAVSNTSSIIASTTWTFSQFLGQAGQFFDYPTLGLDVNAAYIGGNMFSLSTGNYTGTNGYVINRTNLMAGAAYTVYSFFGLATGFGPGPYTPQGVDNFDPSAKEGYFIGVDNAVYGLLTILRVSNPATVPGISGNLSVTVPATYPSRKVPHLGNTNGANGELDALDDRLYAAMARGGHIWTAHNITVDASGVATSGAGGRNGVRWYDITNLTTTPSLVQSGTIYDNTASVASAKDYFIPSVMVSGQGHAAFSLCTAGNNFRINAATIGRLSTDALGTTQGLPVLTTTSTTAYNPPADPGDPFYGRRWGDYSYVSLDPLDDMTMWMINQHCVGSNVYGCNVTKLLAPPPATPALCSPASIVAGQSSVNVVLTGTSINGSGFYDPGTNLPSPALPFNHISASATGGVVVNSVIYTDPTHVILNLNTNNAAPGCQFITITNPDGQSVTSASCILTILSGSCNITLTSAAGTNAQTKCVNTPIANITYATAGATGATFVGLPAGVTGNWAANVATISGTPAATGTFNYSVIPTGGSCNTLSTLGTIAVNTLSVAVSSATSDITSSCGPAIVNLSIQGGSLGTGASWKWYSSSCNGTPIGTGATLNNVAVNATTSFYVRAEGICNTTACAAVTVAINPVPSISIAASPYTSLLPGLITTLTATVLPQATTNTFVWYKDGVTVPGATGNTLSVNVDALGAYTAKVTTAFGCTAITSGAINIVDSASNKLFIIPNPNDGRFTVRYYTGSRNFGFLRNLTIFNSIGQKVFTQQFPITAPYSRMDVDLKKLTKGMYLAVVSDYWGKTLEKGKVIIQ